MRLLATLATAALIVWAANQAAERVDPELWRAPAAAVREGLAQALVEPSPAPSEGEPKYEPDPEPPSPVETSQPKPPTRVPFVAERVPTARVVNTPVESMREGETGPEPVPLTRDEAERIRNRLERVMQLARIGSR